MFGLNPPFAKTPGGKHKTAKKQTNDRDIGKRAFDSRFLDDV